MTTNQGRARLRIRGPGGVLDLEPGDDATSDLALIIEGETSGRPLEEVLAQFGRSRSAYYEKLRRFREAGVEGLLSRPPGPRGPWRRPFDVLRHIVVARLRDPGRTPEAIASDLERLGHRISPRSVARTLSEFGLTRRRPRSSSPAALPEDPERA